MSCVVERIAAYSSKDNMSMANNVIVYSGVM
jgi:hypothetical protein